MRLATLLLAFCTGITLFSQPRVLHFTSTSGFDHGTRNVSYAMFQSISTEIGATVDDAPTADVFSDPGSLAQFDAIVFSNTSGNAILDTDQRTNFENWITSGGHVLGIHAASDTYRHSTANGNNTGTWDYYAELIGASVQENPNHVSGTPSYSMQHTGMHASTANLPDPWVKNEEYYYWEGGYYDLANVEVLRVEETTGSNGQVNSYDAPRPMSWYRELPNGSRVFYTALGHAVENYTSDALFRTHIRDGLAWLLGVSVWISDGPATQAVRLAPNPASNQITVSAPDEMRGAILRVRDVTGREVLVRRIDRDPMVLNVEGLRAGGYLLTMGEHFRAPVLIVR